MYLDCNERISPLTSYLLDTISLQPYINKEDQLSYQESFQSCAASHRSTMAVLQSADNRREDIKQCMEGASLSHADLCQSLQEYM